MSPAAMCKTENHTETTKKKVKRELSKQTFTGSKVGIASQLDTKNFKQK